MNVHIRQATPDDASKIAPLIYEAIGDIANRLTGEQTPSAIVGTLETMIQSENNRHTYRHTFVAEDDDLLGIIVLYDGKQGRQLDRLWVEELHRKGHSISIDPEAHLAEYYIDTVCVTPQARGKGIGTALLQFAEQQARKLGYKQLSLNVEQQKQQARKLYLSLGFQVTEPWTIIGADFDHMVKEL